MFQHQIFSCSIIRIINCSFIRNYSCIIRISSCSSIRNFSCSIIRSLSCFSIRTFSGSIIRTFSYSCIRTSAVPALGPSVAPASGPSTPIIYLALNSLESTLSFQQKVVSDSSKVKLRHMKFLLQSRTTTFTIEKKLPSTSGRRWQLNLQRICMADPMVDIIASYSSYLITLSYLTS